MSMKKSEEPQRGEPRWRVSVDFIDAGDVVLKFDTESDAEKFAQAIVKDGCFLQNRKTDSSKYTLCIVPLHRIRQITVFEVEKAAG